MSRLPLLFVVAAFPAFAQMEAESLLSTIEIDAPLGWGSFSAQALTPGFYAQRFAFEGPVTLEAISVFVYDHPEQTETNSSINFGVWEFDGVPGTELFLSTAQPIATSEVGAWKTFKLPTHLRLERGEYLIGAGQRDLQGFVAFGNARAVDDMKGGLWMYGLSGWFQFTQLVGSEACPTFRDCTVMIRLSVVYDESG